ncbi:hypothetical protein K502DRAFT_344397 [Neoconidiobolus thromboides FSU 785]|nr:hypothetical protein K502DRAFT_344397 [Neoconidiobolus thromboides FSU 785]
MMNYLRDLQKQLNELPRKGRTLIMKSIFPCLNLKGVYFQHNLSLELVNIESTVHFLSDFKFDYVSFLELNSNPGVLNEFLKNKRKGGVKGIIIDNKEAVSEENKQNNSNFYLNYINENDFDSFKNDLLTMNQHQFEKNKINLIFCDMPTLLEGDKEYQKGVLLRQIIMSLTLVEGGIYVLKLANTLSKFTHDILYLNYLLFDKVYLIQPPTVNPILAEKYLICQNLKYNLKQDETNKLIEYYKSMISQETKGYLPSLFNNELKFDLSFIKFLKNSNTSLLANQIEAHHKIIKCLQKGHPVAPLIDFNTLKTYAGYEFEIEN